MCHTVCSVLRCACAVPRAQVPLFVREGGLYGKLEQEMAELPPLFVVPARGGPPANGAASSSSGAGAIG